MQKRLAPALQRWIPYDADLPPSEPQNTGGMVSLNPSVNRM